MRKPVTNRGRIAMMLPADIVARLRGSAQGQRLVVNLLKARQKDRLLEKRR
jgi:hypothetical protein